jgi:hypothetical protein
MRTRTFALILVAILLVPVVAACGATATPTTLPTATKAPATAAPAAAATTAPAASKAAPTIPHDLTGRANCMQCHAAGGQKPIPADHAGRTVDTCQSCHKAR